MTPERKADTQDEINAARIQEIEQRVWDDALAQSVEARLSKAEQRLDALEQPSYDRERTWAPGERPVGRAPASIHDEPELELRDDLPFVGVASRLESAAPRGDDDAPCAYRFLPNGATCGYSRNEHHARHAYVAPEPAPEDTPGIVPGLSDYEQRAIPGYENEAWALEAPIGERERTTTVYLKFSASELAQIVSKHFRDYLPKPFGDSGVSPGYAALVLARDYVPKAEADLAAAQAYVLAMREELRQKQADLAAARECGDALELRADKAEARVRDQEPVAVAVLSMLARIDEWTGTASDLLPSLGKFVTDDQTRKSREWPKDATRLGGTIRRLAPALRANGIDVVSEREGGTGRRLIVLRRMNPATT